MGLFRGPVKREVVDEIMCGEQVVPSWYDIARYELGVEEINGSKHHPRILLYHQATSLKAKDDETSWCASFVNWCMNESNHKGTFSASARSFLNWGNVIEKPRLGCVVVFWRVSIKSWKGHVGFYAGEEGDSILCLGGNQNDRVSVKKYPKSRVLGYRWP